MLVLVDTIRGVSHRYVSRQGKRFLITKPSDKPQDLVEAIDQAMPDFTLASATEHSNLVLQSYLNKQLGDTELPKIHDFALTRSTALFYNSNGTVHVAISHGSNNTNNFLFSHPVLNYGFMAIGNDVFLGKDTAWARRYHEETDLDKTYFTLTNNMNQTHLGERTLRADGRLRALLGAGASDILKRVVDDPRYGCVTVSLPSEEQILDECGSNLMMTRVLCMGTVPGKGYVLTAAPLNTKGITRHIKEEPQISTLW